MQWNRSHRFIIDLQPLGRCDAKFTKTLDAWSTSFPRGPSSKQINVMENRHGMPGEYHQKMVESFHGNCYQCNYCVKVYWSVLPWKQRFFLKLDAWKMIHFLLKMVPFFSDLNRDVSIFEGFNLPTLSILTPQNWLFWGPIHPRVIQLHSPFHWRVHWSLGKHGSMPRLRLSIDLLKANHFAGEANGICQWPDGTMVLTTNWLQLSWTKKTDSLW